MHALMKRLRKRRLGFTLIELIVVMAIIAILAMIAVPRLAQFREMAEARRTEANERIVTGAVAMEVAKLGSPSLWTGLPLPIVWSATSMQTGPTLTDNSGNEFSNCYAWGPYFDKWPQGGMVASIASDGEVTFDHAGPGGTVNPTVTRVNQTVARVDVGDPVAIPAPTPGNLLVVVVGHVAPTSDASAPTITQVGWALRGTSIYGGGVGATRRVVSMFSKIAAAGDTTVTVNWSAISSGRQQFVIVQEFASSGTFAFQSFHDATSEAASTATLTITGAAGSNTLAVAGMVWKDGSPYITNLQFSAMGGVLLNSGENTTEGGMTGAAAWKGTDNSTSSTTVTYTNAKQAQGILGVFTVIAP